PKRLHQKVHRGTLTYAPTLSSVRRSDLQYESVKIWTINQKNRITMNKTTKLVKSILVSSLAFSATLAHSVSAAPVVVPDAPQIAAKGFVLMDYHSGKVLAEKEMDTKLSPASLTKMMTSYVIGQELGRGNINLEDDVVI